jgi:hypothetical protein
MTLEGKMSKTVKKINFDQKVLVYFGIFGLFNVFQFDPKTPALIPTHLPH